MPFLPFRRPPPDPADVSAARRTLGFTTAQLADVLAVPEAQVRDWERGVSRVPRRHADGFRTVVEVVERTRRIEDDLKACPWEERWAKDAPPDDASDAWDRHVERYEVHTATCEVCRANEQALAEAARPRSFPPSGGTTVLHRLAERRPRWLWTPIALAATVAATVGLPGFLIGLASGTPVRPASLEAAEVGLVCVSAVVAGGSLFMLLCEPRRRLGRAGDYLAGLACGAAAAAAIVLLDGVLTASLEPPGRGDWMMIGVLGAAFGLALGRWWFREP